MTAQDSGMGLLSGLPGRLEDESTRAQWGDIGNRIYLYIRSKRGGVILGGTVLVLLLIGLVSQAQPETRSLAALASYYPSWSSPFVQTQSPLLTASDTTHELESGNLTELPKDLTKQTPAFRLVVRNPEADEFFCKFTLSSILLNYPPPTFIDKKVEYDNDNDREVDQLQGVYLWLLDKKNVQDDDLVMLVDGNSLLFQLPAEVIISEYEQSCTEANARLLQKYGNDPEGRPRFQQTVVWAAGKKCSSGLKEKPACKAVPQSPLPKGVYGEQTDKDPEGLLHRPKYLHTGAVMGPAKDLRAMYVVALNKLSEMRASNPNVKVLAHEILSTVFGEQELARTSIKNGGKLSQLGNWISKNKEHDLATAAEEELDPEKRYELSLGLDYTQRLFAVTTTSAPSEYDFLIYNQSMKPQNNNKHKNYLPTSLEALPPPFLSHDFETEIVSEDNLGPYIDHLDPITSLDTLPNPQTNYTDIHLFTNALFPSLPASLLINTNSPETEKPIGTRSIQMTEQEIWPSLWFQPYSRALLRRYLRHYPQGPIAAHEAQVGGDRLWDLRGGQSGVWDDKGHWYEWGVDMCHDESETIFGDGKGKWMEEKIEQDDMSRRLRKRRKFGLGVDDASWLKSVEEMGKRWGAGDRGYREEDIKIK